MRPDKLDAARLSPGRYCPLSYRYSPDAFRQVREIEAAILYVVGGLYGNAFALDSIVQLAQRESGPVTLVFNGDFNWFNVDANGFEAINARVLAHHALRGNVETELANDDAAAGCGCAYPEYVSNAEVARSNLIEDRLRATARAFPALRERLGALPMIAVARVGGVRIGIVHGDAEALAGWGFGRNSLDDPALQPWLAHCFSEAHVRVFASSHTCLAACRMLADEHGPCAVINNGAAGMPNFSGAHYGVITRISIVPARDPLYGVRIEGVHVDALAVNYDQEAWLAAFLQNWAPGSPAHDSYWNRLIKGPAGNVRQAAPVPANNPEQFAGV